MARFAAMLIIFLYGAGTGTLARADDYGCRVMLCLSNPQGPMAVQQCVPPIQQFLREQAKQPPDPFPSCPEAAPSTMQPAMRYYDACPADSSELGAGARVVKLSATQFSAMKNSRMGGLNFGLPGDTDRVAVQGSVNAPTYTGIGTGDQQTFGARANKVCVAKPLGSVTVVQATGDESTGETYLAYEAVSIIEPSTSPRVVDIFVDQSLYRSVRY